MSQNQQTEIQELNSAAIWINVYTLPNGYVLGDKGYATLSKSLISAVYFYISQTNTSTNTHLMVPLLPAPSKTPPIPPIINTNHSQAVTDFGR